MFPPNKTHLDRSVIITLFPYCNHFDCSWICSLTPRQAPVVCGLVDYSSKRTGKVNHVTYTLREKPGKHINIIANDFFVDVYIQWYAFLCSIFNFEIVLLICNEVLGLWVKPFSCVNASDGLLARSRYRWMFQIVPGSHVVPDSARICQIWDRDGSGLGFPFVSHIVSVSNTSTIPIRLLNIRNFV